MSGSAGWLMRLMAVIAVVAGLAVGASGTGSAWAAPAAVPGAVAQGDDDEETPEADDEDTDETEATEEAAADDDEQDSEAEVYESPLYGYTLTFDPAVWEIFQKDQDPDDEYDQLFLTNGVSILGLTGDPDYDEDSLDDCVGDYIGGLEEDESASAIEPLDEPDAEGEEDDRVWATFAYTYEVDGDEGDFVRYYECRLLADDVTVVVLQDAPAADYEDEVEAREELLEGFAAPDGADDEDEDADATEEADEDAAEEADEEATEEADEDEDEDQADLLADVEEYEVDDLSHTDDPVDYEQTPPVGGPHSPVWQDCGFYDEPIVPESGVHSMEHGAVWITYDPDLDDEELEILEELADSSAYVLVSPFEDLPSPIVASAWGVQLKLDSADDPALEAFVEFYAEGPQTPELGAPCFGGTSETA